MWLQRFPLYIYCGSIFAFGPSVALVISGFFCCLTSKEFFLPPLPYKHEPKREEYHQLSSFYCGSIFAFGPSVALVISGFLCCPISKESPSPLGLISMSRRSKDTTSSLNGKGEGDSFDVGQQKKPKATRDTLGLELKMHPQ